MSHQILPISERGQITIPKKMRRQFKAKFLTCEFENGTIVLKPLKTREEFFEELEAAEKDWEKNGGVSWEEVMKKAGLQK
ncbi:AbrB/MazE/SpoVT family DNA-binding domain-containing protein [Candidatus Peregrinibacteria bacterium]|nr:AbrB/MazE/SpoVT family DNA-binding domain-containing protein [Candidatus Peregrinibacteria bacterium]